MSRRAMALAGAGLLTACAGGPAGRTPLVVFAASSLTDAFSELESSFEQAHTSFNLRLAFAGSQVLRLQLEQGAAADVFVSADEHHVNALVQSGQLRDPEVIASNDMALIVPRHNPAGLQGFADLPQAELVVLGSETVPVGRYARQVLDRAAGQLGPAFVRRVLGHVVSLESNTRRVRAKVELGEADAALVYRSDVDPLRVLALDIPDAFNVRAHYVLGVATDTSAPRATQAFIEHLRSGEGRAILARHGLSEPE